MKRPRIALLALALVGVSCEEEGTLVCETDADCGGIASCVDARCVAPEAILECSDGCSSGELCYAGECLPTQNECVACRQHNCLVETVACNANAECQPVASCVADCDADEECSAGCAAGHSYGARALSALYDCFEGCEGCRLAGFENPLTGMSLKSAQPGRFVMRLDGTVEDTSSGLLWDRFPGAAAPWDESGEYCDALDLAGQTDWRMPTIEELLTLLTADEGSGGEYEGGCYWNSAFEGDCEDARYWSATELSGDEVRVVGYYLGTPNTNSKGDNAHVRCVRGDQSSE